MEVEVRTLWPAPPMSEERSYTPGFSCFLRLSHCLFLPVHSSSTVFLEFSLLIIRVWIMEGQAPGSELQQYFGRSSSRDRKKSQKCKMSHRRDSSYLTSDVYNANASAWGCYSEVILPASETPFHRQIQWSAWLIKCKQYVIIQANCGYNFLQF